MKTTKIYFLLMLAAITGLTSCEKEEELYPQLGEDPRTLEQIISETPEVSAFFQTMSQVDLDSLLGTTSTFTVFAPGNSAFDAIDPTALGQAEYENLVLNHVVTTVTADFTSTLETGYVPTLATGPDEQFLDLFINTEGELVINGTASLVEGVYDLGGTNGVLHVVNEVLVPPTVVDHLEANPIFSSFTEAVEIVGLTETLEVMAVTNPEAPGYPLTVFVPTDTAFQNLLTRLNGAFGWETLEDIPVDVLKEIIMHHIIKGSNNLVAQIQGTEQTTSQGEILVVNNDGTIADASYTTTNISVGDIQAINGVVHAVDKVLLTESIFQDLLGATLNLVEQSEDKGFSTFLTAVEKVGLSEELSTEELTLFAPNNAAFETFFGKITNFESLEDFDTHEELELLKNVLEYHLHAGMLLSSEMSDGSLSTLREDELIVETSTGSLVPSLEHAPSASFVANNIGAINGVIHEIGNVLVSAMDADALGYPEPATGGPVFGYEIYHDALNEALWYSWSEPDFANMEEVYSGEKAIKVDLDGWAAFQVGGTGQDLSQYTTIDFALYSETGTSVKLYINGKSDSGAVLQVPAGEWTVYSVPIVNIADGTSTLDELVIQDQSGVVNTLFLDQIGLDVSIGSDASAFDLRVYDDAITTEWIEAGFDSDGWHYNTTVVWDSAENVLEGSNSGIVVQQEGGTLKFGQGAPGFDLSDYSTFQFSVYTPTAITFNIVINGMWDESHATAATKAGEWTTISIPLSAFTADFTKIETIEMQLVADDASLYPYTYYIDEIGFIN